MNNNQSNPEPSYKPCDYGYVRRSTPKQDAERQFRNIKRVCPDAKFFFDTYTGTKRDGRKDWQQLMKVVRSHDSIYFDSVSRMSRNAEEGMQDYVRLYYLGVNLFFLKEPHINTSVFRAALEATVPMTGTNVDYILEGVNKYLMEVAKEQIRIAFEQAEKEVLDLRQRTREGIITARINGKQIGRPAGTKIQTKKSIASKLKIMEISKSFNGTLTDLDCIRLLGISRNTYYKYKRELETELTSELDEDAAMAEREKYG